MVVELTPDSPFFGSVTAIQWGGWELVVGGCEPTPQLSFLWQIAAKRILKVVSRNVVVFSNTCMLVRFAKTSFKSLK